MDKFFLFSQEYPPFVPALAVVALVVAFAFRLMRSFAEEHGVSGVSAYRCWPTSSRSALDAENFRIDSTGWRPTTLSDGTRVKIGQFPDVIEIAEGPYRGEQLFTWEAAMRETAAASKRIPGVRDWEAIVRSARAGVYVHGERLPEYLRRKLRLKLVGHSDLWPLALQESGHAGYCWLNSGSPTSLIAADLGSMVPMRLSSNENNRAFSVRCLKG